MSWNDLAPLANHLWQSTVFVGLAWVLTLALGKNRAAVRYGVWLAASAKFLIPFAWLASLGAWFGGRAAPVVATVRIPIAMEQIGQPFAAVGPAAIATPAAPAPLVWPVVLLGVWLCGVAVGLVFWARVVRRMGAILRGAEALDLDLPIPVKVAPGRIEPGIFGIWKPVLLLPEGITERLTPEQLEAVLAHELRHVRRRDNLTAAVHALVETIFWFHPAPWWIRRHLVDERERACDEGALRMGKEPRVYAEGILKICELYLTAPVTCAAGVTGGELRRRIEGIMENRFGLKLGLGKRVLLGAGAFAVVTLPLALGVVHAGSHTGVAGTLPRFEVASVKPVNPEGKGMVGLGEASSSAEPAKGDYRFEVASIRRGDPSGRWTGVLGPSSPRRFTAESATIVSLAMRAFGVNPTFQIEYQRWMASTFFNVIATIPEGATAADLPNMIQHLLEDRFGLVFHRETRRMAGYQLVVAKSGPKLTKSMAPPSGKPARMGGDIVMKNGVPQFTKDAGSGRLFIGRTTALWRGRNKTMKSLTEDLAGYLGLPVMDGTGIDGEYDYTLTFTPEAKAVTGNTVVMSPPSAAPAQESRQEEFLTNPLLRDALQIQLGLELQPVKNVPVEVIVLDSARKEPTEN